MESKTKGRNDNSENKLRSGDVPFCSIVIPMFNACETLESCLDSISRLNYPKDRCEVLLVDNGSTDNSMDIARSYNVSILEETSFHSSYAARNAGIVSSRGELIAFTDADCIVSPDWILHLAAHWNDEEYGSFAGDIQSYQPENLVEVFSDRKGILSQARTLRNSYLPYPQTANAAYRRTVFDRIGLFVPEMASGGDAYIAWKMQKELGLKVKYLPRALVYHKHRSSIQGLYQQSIKYEYGKFYWTEYFPDYEFPSTEERRLSLESSVQQHCRQLKKNLRSLLNERIDFAGFAASFLEMIMCAGTYKARIDIEKSKNKKASTAFNNSLFDTEDDLQSAIIANGMTAGEMESIIAQKDELIQSILHSRSWKMTAPFRKLASLFRSK